MERMVEKSPSGRYELLVEDIPTRPGCWNYQRGTVTREGAALVVVERNYSSFPFLWVEGHPDGHDYLVCGANYQGQTVVQLDTGKRRDYLPSEAAQGGGFCWAAYRFDAATRILIVSGCYWAGPYEFRFYDFADPMSGWPELDTGGQAVWDDARWPELDADGTVRCFDTREPDFTEDDSEPAPGELKAVKTFRRDGRRLVFVEEWVSEHEKKERADRAEEERRWQVWLAEFRASDPLYLEYKRLVGDSRLRPDNHEGHGVTHGDWCPDFKAMEWRWCRRIVSRGREEAGPAIDLEWAVETGPVKVTVYRDKSAGVASFFPHSVEGMRAAFDLAFAVMGSPGGVG